MGRKYKERNLTKHYNEDEIALFFDTYISHWTIHQLKYLRSLIDMELRVNEIQHERDVDEEDEDG